VIFNAEDRLAEKLAGEKRFEKWIYDVPAYSVDPILKPRGQLLAEVEVKKDASSPPDK
jgi:hypothetical protein